MWYSFTVMRRRQEGNNDEVGMKDMPSLLDYSFHVGPPGLLYTTQNLVKTTTIKL